jgi:hypothetical protein
LRDVVAAFVGCRSVLGDPRLPHSRATT